MFRMHRTMTAVSEELSPLGRAVIAAAIILVISGVLWHGVTMENVQRIWRNAIGRPSATLSSRFILQPIVAAIPAANDGLKDARRGRSPFLRAVLKEPSERTQRLNEGLHATATILVLGIAVDIVFQFLEFDNFYPIESVLIALLLAFIPYCIVRSLVVRVWSKAASAPRAHQGYEQ
jgi:hypothetical protein